MRTIHIEIFANMKTQCVFLDNVEDYRDTYKPQYKFDVFDIVKLEKDEPSIGLQFTHEVNGKGILMMNVDTEAAKKINCMRISKTLWRQFFIVIFST